MQKICTTPTKHLAMTVLVNGMFQVEATQEGIGSHLCRTQYIVPTVSFGLPEAKQFLYTSSTVAPDPAVDGSENSIESCGPKVSQ